MPFLIIETRDDGYPHVHGVFGPYTDMDKTLDLGVQSCKKQGAEEPENEIRKQLQDEGEYAPAKVATWSVSFLELSVEQPAPPDCPCGDLQCPYPGDCDALADDD